jgi:hypothetical protein
VVIVFFGFGALEIDHIFIINIKINKRELLVEFVTVVSGVQEVQFFPFQVYWYAVV